MAYTPEIEDLNYDEDTGIYRDSESGDFYTVSEEGKIYEAGSDHPIN